MRPLLLFSVWAVVWLSARPALVRAEDGDPTLLRPGWAAGVDLYGVVNPNASALVATLDYQVPFREKFDMVWSQASLGYRLSTCPVTSAVGISAEWMPAAVWRVRAMYDLMVFHNTMGSLSEYDADQSPIDVDDVLDSSNHRAALGHRMAVVPLLTLYFKGLLLLNYSEFKWTLVDSERAYYYNFELMTLSEPTDFAISSQSLLMYNFVKQQPQQTFFVGVAHTVDFQPSNSFRKQSAGIAVLTEPFKTVGRWGKLHVLVISGIWLEDDFRTNELFVLLNVGSSFDLRR